MISEQALIAWLIIQAYEFNHDHDRFGIPSDVADELVRRGWMTLTEEVDWEGDHKSGLTDAGRTVVDLNAAEYGWDVLPVEKEA